VVKLSSWLAELLDFTSISENRQYIQIRSLANLATDYFILRTAECLHLKGLLGDTATSWQGL